MLLVTFSLSKVKRLKIELHREKKKKKKRNPHESYHLSRFGNVTDDEMTDEKEK